MRRSLNVTVVVIVMTGGFLGLSTTTRAQHVVRGSVTDAVTGLPLPSANVLIQGTNQGTITNADGDYVLEVHGVPAALVVRYVGYQTQHLVIEDRPVQRVEVALQPVAYQMPEVVVTDENPAVRLMRCVIHRKQGWRASLASYSADAYTRFTVSNDTGIVSIIESLSEIYWERDRGSREIVKSQRQTSNLNIAMHLPAAQFVTNLYDDNIELAGYEFMGVTHPRALNTYRFAIEGTRMMDDRLVHDVRVEPKNHLKTAFIGTLAVLEKDCALVEAALQPGEAFFVPPPMKHLDITFYQQYNQFDGEAWLPVDLRSDITLEVSMGFLLSFPPFRIRQVSRLTNYEVDIEVPDTLFEREVHLIVDKKAVEADTLLEREGVAVPLDSLERMAYQSIDTTMTMDEAFAPSGALARLVDDEDDEGNKGDDGPPLVGRLNLEPRLRFNRVEAFYGGIGTEHKIGRLRIAAGTGWSSALDDAWSFDADLEMQMGLRNRGYVRGAYFNGVEPRYRSSVFTAPMTSIYSVLGAGDYHDYMGNSRTELRLGYERERTEISVAVRREHPYSVAAATGYDLRGGGGEMRVNPEIGVEAINSVSVRTEFGSGRGSLGFAGRRYAVLELERGVADGGDKGFIRLSVEGDWRINTFFRRRMLPNAIDVHLAAGTHWGDLPIIRFGIIDGSLGAYKPFGGLRTRSGRPYQGDRYVGMMWEHSFRTVPFELLRLRALARRGYAIILTGGHAHTWITRSPYLDDPAPFGGARQSHHELGLALSGLFSFLRVDVTARIGAPGITIGISSARLF